MRYEGFPTAAQLERLECFATAEQMSSMFKNAPAQPAPPKAPPTQQSQAASGALSAQISSPVPQHLRGISLGTQNAD
jgi:hypothetical protein